MTERQKREQRRRWRVNSRKYLNKLKEQKKLETILLDNSPPDSETEGDPAVYDPLEEVETPKARPKLTQDTSSALRKLRYRSRKVICDLQRENNKLKNKNSILSKQLHAEREMRKENNSNKDTIEKKVDQVINDIKADKIEEVKKKLLFNETISRGVSNKYKSLSKKEKMPFAESVVDRARLKKYKVLSKASFAIKKKYSEKGIQEKKTENMKRKVREFFEEDIHSQVAPGKKEFVKSGGFKHQKRYLTANIKNLHVKFCEDWGRISYSTFCKHKPKWVVPPSGKRDTCQCKLHANIDLLVKSLKKVKIIQESNHIEVLNNVCCNRYNTKCLERKCQTCKNKVTRYQEFDNSKNIVFYEWIFEKQVYQGKDGKEKIKRVTLKKGNEDAPRNVINKFENLMPVFLKHTFNKTVQESAIKELKKDLCDNEVLFHIDFSENYLLKYNEEIQSFHFGGSRQQISLHTGVLYYIDSEKKEKTCKSYCTMAKNINHDASAIWAHLEPILNTIQELVPRLTTIHFLSDSPSCQYRNRFIFFMMSKLKEQIRNLKLVTWNYSEAGHGKGAPDGIGAIVKRTADDHVKYGGDVATFEDFVQIVQKNIENVELIVIADENISKKKFPKDVPTFRGTTKVHQALWSSTLPFDIAFRSLSCFACRDSYVPCSHGKHLGMLNVGLCQEATASTEENLSPYRRTAYKSKVNILSNVPVNYQRFTMHGSNSRGFSSIDQTEFEKFLQRPVLENFEDSFKEVTIKFNTTHDQYTSNTTDGDVEVNEENTEELKYDVEDWVVVEYKMKKKSQYFIGKIIEKKLLTLEYTINFVRKVPGKSVKFGWPVISDDDIVPESRIVHLLEKPEESRRGQFTFKKLPANLNVK